IDAASWAACAHLAAGRAGAPLVVADAAEAPLRVSATWVDTSTSPLVAAAAGTLVVLDAGLLPADAVDAVDAGARDAPALVVLVQRLDGPPLARPSNPRGPTAAAERVRLPGLAERPDDLRTCLLDAFARAGLRARGAPLGLEPGALRALLDHAFPGNDQELDELAVRVAARASGPVVTPADLVRAGFALSPTAATTPLPPLLRRSRRRGAPRRDG
ncbi:MAG: hypothetical protein IT376_02375, partial [Polyangiaceae bacterium]|nr:hypothetical protein [Polyangiaceae bacterium]